jgi:SAM-dependent methyltransferase
MPFEDGSFDAVVAIDVHEHMQDPTPFTDELKRVVRPGGTVIVTVPNGNSRKLACRIKTMLGMTPEVYGHQRWGYDIEELSGMMKASGLEPVATSSYARFFTEMVELAINFMYVKVLKKNDDNGDGDDHAIAPGTEEDLRKVQKTFRIYSMAYPVLKAVSLLDVLVFTRGYAVVVEATAPTATASGSGED